MKIKYKKINILFLNIVSESKMKFINKFEKRFFIVYNKIISIKRDFL